MRSPEREICIILHIKAHRIIRPALIHKQPRDYGIETKTKHRGCACVASTPAQLFSQNQTNRHFNERMAHGLKNYD